MSTGGDLNMLNGQMGISAPYQSVAVMKLIKQHSPKSKHELVELIKYHYEHTCSCGIVSKGSVAVMSMIVACGAKKTPETSGTTDSVAIVADTTKVVDSTVVDTTAKDSIVKDSADTTK